MVVAIRRHVLDGGAINGGAVCLGRATRTLYASLSPELRLPVEITAQEEHIDMATVIVGTGIIGVSTAYYLSESSTTSATSIHLIESSPRLFASASGYAAGFLAKDWFSSATAPLGALSFALHKELADRYGGREKWGYSPSTATSLQAARRTALQDENWLSAGRSRSQLGAGDAPGWLVPQKGHEVEVISEGGSTAQVCVLFIFSYSSRDQRIA